MLSTYLRLLLIFYLVVRGLGFCGTYEYYCTLDRCIGATWVCDGSKDCEYGDDESAIECRDDEYPRFDLCPDDITVITDPGTNYQTARWREPRARDNRGIKYRGKSHSPGRKFYLRNGNSTAHTVRYWATDYAGNTAYCIFKVIVMDEEPPKLECPQETSNFYKMEYGFMLISTDEGSPNATITWTANASDNSGMPHIRSFPYKSGDVFPMRLFPPYETTVRASDPSGNTDECVLRFAVVDTGSPVVNCPTRFNSYNFVVRTSDSTWTVFAERGSISIQLDWSPANATDNSGTVVSLSSNYNPGDVFPVSDVAYQITYTAIDEVGNVGNCSVFITVEDDDDGSGGDGVSSETVCNSTEFQCDNQDCIPISLQCDGNTDCSDESDEKVEICQPDHELPEFVRCPNDITVNTNPGTNYKQVSWRHPKAYDDRGIKYRGASHWPGWNYYLVDGNSTVYSVRYWADDYSGNTGECVFTITVIDDEPPKLECSKDISNFYEMEYGIILISTDEGSPNATITWTEVATDNSGMPQVTSFPYKSGDVFPMRRLPPYETTVRATDPTGNINECILRFAVVDTESPVVTCPTQSNNIVSRESNSSWTVFSEGGFIPVQLYWSPANATDNSVTAVSVSSNYKPGDGFSVSKVPHQITYTAIDEAGNVGNCSFFITVKARTYHGCFEDTTWTSAVPKYNNLTIDWCIQHCYDLSYPYAGLQDGDFCRCMGVYLEFYRRPEHECGTVCSGNPQAICGGDWRKSIYNTERVCSSIEFQCDNKECIPTSLQCDGNTDCSDQSDETYEICLKKPCRGNQFDCGKDKVCIPLNWYCNGNNDCEDGIDEATCDYPQLNGCPDDITVGTSQGRNYTEVWWAEPVPSSLTTIKTREQSHSPGHRFEIIDGKTTVYTVRYWVEDVYLSEAQCLFNITVIPRTYQGCFQDTTWTSAVPRHNNLTIEWCIHHCYDLHYLYAGLQYGVYCRCMDEYIDSIYHHRPEHECNMVCGGKSQEICGGDWRKSIYTTETICNRREFQCDNQGCIPISLQCDGTTDCSDESDEKDEICQTRPCRYKQFDCGKGSICIPLTLYCNGNNDCEDGIDEATCNYPQLYRCPDDLTVGTDPRTYYADVWWPEPYPSSYTTIKTREQSHSPIHRFEIIDGKLTVYTVRYWVQDVYLREAQCLFNITVIDNESPVVICPSHSSNFASRESKSAWSVSTDRGSRFARLYWPPANATDNSGTVTSVTSNYNPGDVFRVSNVAYNITYTAIDEAGNVGYCSFFITVQDLESPSVECPSHIETTSTLISWDITISDNLAVVHYFSNDTRVTPTNSLLNGKSFTLAQSGTFHVGTTFIEYLVTDLAWNVGKCLIKVTVQDTKRPSITCPRTFSNYYDYIYGFHRLVTDYGQSYATVTWSPPEVEGNSEGPVTWESYPYTSGDKFPLRLFPPYTVEFTASDFFGNSSSCYVYFTIIDVEPPTITCPTNITNYYDTYFGSNRAALDPNSSTSTVMWDDPTVSDNSGRPVSVTSTHQSGETFAPRLYPPYEVEYTAEDESGNKNACTFYFLVANSRH